MMRLSRDGEDAQPIHAVRIMPSKSLDCRILTGFAFVGIMFVAAVVLTALVARGFKRQLDETNAHLSQIQRQECVDANAATTVYIKQFDPVPAPKLRICR